MVYDRSTEPKSAGNNGEEGPYLTSTKHSCQMIPLIHYATFDKMPRWDPRLVGNDAPSDFNIWWDTLVPHL